MKNKELSVKLVCFTVTEGKLKVFITSSGLPDTDFMENKTLDDTARRIFQEYIKLPLSGSYLEQLYTISQDIKGVKHITVVYYMLYPGYKLDNRGESAWKDAEELSNKTQDFAIINYAIQRLRWKIEYTNIVYSLLPQEFTLSELQSTYETILGKSLDKRNFRKKIISLGLLKPSGKLKTGIKARPAQIYEFKSRKPVMVKVFS